MSNLFLWKFHACVQEGRKAYGGIEEIEKALLHTYCSQRDENYPTHGMAM